MNWNLPSIRNIFERNVIGDTYTFISDSTDWGALGTNNLAISLTHPILTPGILFVAKLFSQADFYMLDKTTGKKDYNDKELDAFTNPNFFQTKNDFLETLMFMQIAIGQAVVWKRKDALGNVNAMYILNPYLIKYPLGFKTRLSIKNENNEIGSTKVTYDENGENIDIPLRDLMFFYDLPNGMDTTNMFKNNSRIDGLKQTLINANDSLLAKNIILKTNGKELITGKVGSVQLTPAEQEEAQNLFNGKFGLGAGRSRSLITKADIQHKSLHIAVRDLGLDESVKVDGNIIYTALHIPKDILSLEAKKTTYNNFKESMVSYLQNEMQSSLDAYTAVFNKTRTDKNKVIVGTFEHLPIMQFVLIERYLGVKGRAEALSALRASGLSDEICLELCGFPKGTKLAKLEKPKNDGNTTQQNTGASPKGKGDNEKGDSQ